MPRYKEVQSLIAIDAAYIAGLVDGEGSISLSRRHASERRQLVVSIANTELGMLEFVLDRVGAGKITRKKTAAVHHTPSAAYSISNRQALSLLEQLYPFLRSHKRERAHLVLSRYVAVTPRNGKYTSATDQLRAVFEREFFSITSRAQSNIREQVEAQVRSPSDSLGQRGIGGGGGTATSISFETGWTMPSS